MSCNNVEMTERQILLMKKVFDDMRTATMKGIAEMKPVKITMSAFLSLSQPR